MQQVLLHVWSHVCVDYYNLLSLQGDWEYCSEQCLKKSSSAQMEDDDLNRELEKVYQECVREWFCRPLLATGADRQREREAPRYVNPK